MQLKYFPHTYKTIYTSKNRNTIIKCKLNALWICWHPVLAPNVVLNLTRHRNWQSRMISSNIKMYTQVSTFPLWTPATVLALNAEYLQNIFKYYSTVKLAPRWKKQLYEVCTEDIGLFYHAWVHTCLFNSTCKTSTYNRQLLHCPVQCLLCISIFL